MRKSLVALVIGSAFLAQQAVAADLLQVYKQALVNDAQFASARATLAAGKERLPQSRSLILPNVGLSGSLTSGDSSANNSGRSTTSIYTLTLSQPLFNLGNLAQYEQGKLGVAAAEAQFAQSQQDLIIRVAQAYFDVLTAQDALELVKAQKTATTEQLASAKRNFEVGTQTITDTHEAQARYDLIVANEFATQNDLEIKRTALQQIIGQTPGTLATLRKGVSIAAPSPANIDAWVQSAEKQNFSVVAAEIAYNSSKQEIKRNRSGHMPTASLVAEVNRTSNASTVTTNSIGVRWSIPIFSGFGVDSKVREAIALESKAGSDLENAKRVASQAARQAFLGVNSGLAQVKAYEAAEISSNSALESNKLGYQVGVRINIDVLNAQQQVFSTRRDLSKARYDTLVNGLRLKSAVGTLTEDDLVQVNSYLQN